MKGVGPEVSLRQLWDFLDSTGKTYMTIPHHTGRAGKYRDFSDPVYDATREPLFEIYSGWGSSESRVSRFPLRGGNSDKPCYFQDALRAGCRYGVIASSDDHLSLPGGEGIEGHMVGPKHLSFHVQHGLAAVRAKELTRESLWHALRQRSCYATTFLRNLLDVRMGDLGMGGQGRIDAGDPLWRSRTVRVRYLAAANPASRVDVVLVRNGDEIERVRSRPDDHEVVLNDETPLEAVAVRGARFHPDPFVVYYVRVEGTHGDTQWSSPIWLDLE